MNRAVAIFVRSGSDGVGCAGGRRSNRRPNKIMDDIRPTARPAPGSLQRWLRKALTLAIVTVVFGWFYGWASPWAFPKNRIADFKYGVFHGALMPLSLPTLVMGKDVPIYDTDNS